GFQTFRKRHSVWPVRKPAGAGAKFLLQAVAVGGIHSPANLFPSPLLMADREDKNPENVPGKFYVDSQCIDCDLCRETAPNNFTRVDNEGYSYVIKQPENDVELAHSRVAMEGCPVEAIGDDGQD